MRIKDFFEYDVETDSFSSEKEAELIYDSLFELITKETLLPDDNIDMLHKAHLLCALRSQCDININTDAYNQFAEAYWLLSRAYSINNVGNLALLFASKALDICAENNLASYETALCYEAAARAYFILKNDAKFLEYKENALNECEKIDETSYKYYLINEIESIDR